MRTIPEVVEDIKNILNDAERTQDGECLVDIDDLVNEILVINSNIRYKAIEEAMEKAAKAICVGCGYLDGVKCTYKGSNCGVSKPMLESVTEVLEQMKASNDLAQ